MTVRTLLVDDNKTFIAAVRNFLLMVPDIEIVGEAHDGWSAVELAKSLNPDLVLLDIVMPEMNGLEVAQALKNASHPSRIVFLSMHDSESYRTAARELGAFAYVGKGDFVADLIPIIDQLVDAVATQDPNQGVAPRELP